MIALVASLALQAAVASPAPVPDPAQCRPFQRITQDMASLSQTVGTDAPRPQGLHPLVQRFVDQREALGQAMKSPTPNLARIEQLMREEDRARLALFLESSEARIACDIARLKAADPVRQREMLDLLRPLTAAEQRGLGRNILSPPPPPAPPIPRR